MTSPTRWTVALGLAVAAIGEARATPPELPRIEWAGVVSVTDVLGTSTDGPPRAVPVPLRPASAAGVRSLAPRFPDLAVTTRCGPGFCVDGLGGPRRVFVATAFTPDERATLAAGTGSWVERGLRVVQADGESVSFQRAEAWFAAGAAHSHGALTCRTHLAARPGVPATLADALGPARARAVRVAAARFLAEAREAAEPRAERLRVPGAKDFLLEDGRLLLCAPGSFEEDAVQVLRVTQL